MLSNGIARLVSALIAVVLFWAFSGCATFKSNATLEFKAQLGAEGTAASSPGYPTPAATAEK